MAPSWKLPGNPTPQSPYVYRAIDANGKAITITIDYNNTTRALLDATVVRDAGCLYGTLYVGFGGDGKVESSTKKISVPVGTRSFTAAQLNAVGLTTIEDITGLQITAAA